MAEQNPFEQFVAPKEENPFEQFLKPEQDPGYLGETVRALKHGAQVTLPKAAGNALKFFGADDTGQSIVEGAEQRDTPDLQESTVGKKARDDRWWGLRGNVASAADNAVMSLAPGAAGAAIGAGLTAWAGPGAAVGALAGYAIGSLASLPIFYGSQAQESYEAVKKHQLELGTPEDEADRIARLTGHAEGTWEAGGELVQDIIPFAKLFKPFGKVAGKAVVSSVLKPTLSGAAKTVGEVVGGEVATEMAQQAGEDWSRKAIGDTGEGATWDETKKVIVPTALMSVFPGGAGAGAHHYKRAVALNALTSPETDPDLRANIAVSAAAAMADGNEDVARAFSKYAADQIEKKAPIEISDDDQFYLQYKLAAATSGDEAIAAADAALSAPIDLFEQSINAFKGEWAAERTPADSALPLVGMPEAAPVVQPAVSTDSRPIALPDRPAGPALIALAEQLSIMPAGEQTKALMRLDSDMRQRVVQTMRAMDPAVPSGLIVPDASMPPGQGEASRLVNEATTAASSVQPTSDAAVGNVPAYTQRAAQEIVSKDPSQEMRPHREVANRFEVVPVMPARGTGRAVPPTLQPPVGQQQLAEQETPQVPAAPAARPVVPAAPLTAEQLAANQAAADAERSSQPRHMFRDSQLRSETGPDIKGEKVTRNMRRVLAQMGRITGTKVVFEFAPGESDGAVPNREENTIHINTAAQINPMQVMGHEVTHVLRSRHAAAWGKIRDALVATMPDKRAALDAFAADYWGVGDVNAGKLAAARAIPDWSQALTPEQKQQFGTPENTIEAFLLDEMVSDLGGQHWSDEKFWLDVFAKIEKAEGAKSRGIIERLVIALRETLAKFLAVVRAQKQGDYATVSVEQIEATRDAISSAYAQFIRAERGTEPSGEPHVTDHRISTSDTHSRSQGDGEVAPPVPERKAAPETGDELGDARAAELASLSPSRPDQRLFFEVAPNPKDKAAVAAWDAMSNKDKQSVSNKVTERVIPGLLRSIGVTGEVVTQLGGWKSKTNPSFALVVTKGDPLLTARAIGYVLDQEAVYALGLKSFTGGTKTGIIHFEIGRKDAHNIYKQVRDLARGIITGHSTVGGEMLIGLPMADMQRLRSAVEAVARKADVAVNFDSGYSAIVKENDYGIQFGQQNTRQQHPAARDVDKWRTKAREAFGPNAAGRGSDREGAVFSSDRPSYGTVRFGTGVSAVGVHYSQAQRETLSSRFFGTGMKGEERARIMHSNDERIKRRLYFYTNEGAGIAPESGVGSHAHSVMLNNLYDIDADRDNLVRHADPTKDWRDQPIAPSLLMNHTEAAIIDAGYDGYVTHEFGRGGAIVLLGDHSVPVQYDGLGARPDVPVAERAAPSPRRAAADRIAADRTLPSGRMTGAEWKRLVPEATHLADDKSYYKSALAGARMSESRPPSWYYSPLTRAAESAQMKQAPASGWRTWLKSLAAKGVKPDEIKWSGIEEWLDAQGEARVTREQVQAYLSEFGVKVETILRGERNPIRPEAITQEDEDADYDIELNVGEWETDEPDESWLSERASELLEEEIDQRVEDTWEDIYDDIQREARTQIEVMLPDLTADIRREMGDMFPVDDELIEQVTRNYAAAQVVGDTWEEYAVGDLDDDAVMEDAVDRAFAVASGDIEALEIEARRRARADINEDKLLDELTDRERTYYYDDYDSPQRQQITVDGVDGYFYHTTSYGERSLYYDGRNIPLPRRADEADVEGAIREYVMENGLVSGRSGDGSGYRATKWEDKRYNSDTGRAVPGSYREVQLTLPVGAFGQPKSRVLDDALHEGGVETERDQSAKDFYYTTHWSEANVIGHARWDEHRDADGKRVLVLQEVQGDWGQQRREGLEAQEKYEAALVATAERRDEYRATKTSIVAMLPDAIGWTDRDWLDVERLGSQGLATVPADVAAAADKLMRLTAEIRDLQREYDALSHDLPDAAPFIEKTAQWSGLVMKRMIAHAVDYGFDKVVWTSGAQQVERWRSSLRQQVDTIAWEKTEDGIHIVASQNGRQRTDTKVSETALSDAIGKTMAKQIIADPNQRGEITGDDITISDTGMAGFYDRMLPNIANDILKKFDKTIRVGEQVVHPEPTYSIRPDPDSASHWQIMRDGHELVSHPTKERAEENIEKLRDAQRATAITTQQGFEITDKLRESAANGMPLFSQRRASSEARKSEARKEWYRSQLSDAVGGLPSKIKTGKEAALWLTSNAGKLGVKKDEITWSGVTDWLATQRSVTGAQIQDWLANNGVRVKDVVLGAESDEYHRLDAELQAQEGKVDTLRKAAIRVSGKIEAKIINNSGVAETKFVTQDELNEYAGDYRVHSVQTDGVHMPQIRDIRDAAAGNGAALRVLQSTLDADRLDAMLEYGKALNRKNELFEQRKAAMGEPTKYDAHVLPGGSKYRELLLTLPADKAVAYNKDNIVPIYEGEYVTDKNRFWYFKAPDNVYQIPKNRQPVEADAQLYIINNKQPASLARFQSGHFPQPNILAHVRFDERTDADGKRVLFVQEVQSDWAQKGRKDGFNTPVKMPDGTTRTPTTGVPSAPFVTDTKAWVALALKRAISHAVDNGFDRVAWTTGEQQAERYDLSKQVSRIDAIKKGELFNLYLFQNEGEGSTSDVRDVPADKLDDYVGKELAARISKDGGGSYKGLDLKVGGEGMVAFYDGIVKQVARSLGATVGEVRLDNGWEEYKKYGKGEQHRLDAQPGFDITERMKEQAAVGMPLFSTARKSATWTPERIDRLMRKYAYTMDDSKTKAFAAWIDPEDFLRMTSAPDDIARIERAAGDLDEAALRDNDQELFLEVSDITAAMVRVEGHEGRHRTTALIRAGVRKMPVVLWLRGGAMRDAESAKSLYLAPQKFGREAHEKAIGGGFVTGLTPISYAYEQTLRDTFGGDGDIRFSEPRPSAALDQWLGKSVVRTVMYHGTARDITTFRPQQADAIFLTDDPKFAGEFADLSHGWLLSNYWTWMSPEQIQSARRDAMRMLLQDALPGSSLYMREERLLNQSQQPSQYMRRAVEQYMPSDSNVMPLYVRAEKPFDYRNPEHVTAIEAELGPSWMGQESIGGEDKQVAQHIGDLERGDWNAIESPQVQNYIRAHHDSFYVRERGVTNLAVFSPNQVKSASGNSGAYSQTDNDIRRSERRKPLVDAVDAARSELDHLNADATEDEVDAAETGLRIAQMRLRDYDDNDIRRSEVRDRTNIDTATRRMDKFVSAFVDGAVKSSDTQILGPTPVVMRAAGAPDLSIEIDGTTLEKALKGKHSYAITADMLKKLPEGLYDPIALFMQPEGGVRAITELTTANGHPVVVGVHFSVSSTRMLVNRIATVYEYERAGERFMEQAKNLRYVRDEKALELSSTPTTPFRVEVVQKARELGADFITEADLVKLYTPPRYSTPRSRMTGAPINQTWTDPDVTDWDDFVRKMQDDKIDTKRVLRAIRDAGVAIAERFDAYLMETNYHGRAAARVDEFADGELRHLLEDMAMRGVSMQDLDDYLWARHAPERNAANAKTNPAITDGSGMSDAQSAAILAGQAVTVGTRTIQLTAKALRGAAAVSGRVDAITKGTLDLLVSSGLETQQTVNTWRKTYAHYAPLKRDMESDANYSGAFGLGNGTGTGFSVRGAASRRALGSKRAVTDVLANIAMQRERAITRSEKNRVAQAVYGLALSAPNPEFWIPVNTEMNKRLSPAALQKVIAELVSIGVNPIDAQNLATEPVQRYPDPKTGLETTRINPHLRGREDVLSTRINGEDRYVFFSNKKRAQQMVRGLKNLDAADVSGFLQVVAPVTRWFASINTQYNPVFGLTNGVRDFSTGMLNLSSTPLAAHRADVARNAFSALKGVYLDLRDHRAGKQPTSQWAQLFEQFALDGGQTGYRDMFATSTERADAIADELKHAGKGQSWLAVGEKRSHIFGWLSDYNTAVENAMRLSSYKVALDNGMSRDAAASLAKNLTVNFNKKGLAATQTGALYAFFNASVQGTARMAETMTTDGKLNKIGQKIVYGGMMLGVLQATLGALAGWDDDEPPQFSREKNFIIPIPGSDKYVSLPMPLGFHVIPNIGRIVTEWLLSGGRDPGKRLTRLANVVLDSFNPIGSGTLAQTLSPTVGDPIIALGENKDWTGKSIYKEDFNKMHPTPGWTRTKDSASPPSRWMSYAINYITGGGKYGIGMASPTPDQLDYLVGQATGGTGRELLKTAQYLNAKATGEDLPIYKTPLGVGRFVGETKGQSSEISQFYRNLERIGEHKSALDEMKHDGNGAAMREYLAANPDARLVQMADKAQREIGYLRRQKRELIEKDAGRERVKLLEDRITATTRRYNEMMRAR